MADFIYNDFSPEPSNEDEHSSSDSASTRASGKGRNNLIIAIVCIFFVLILLLMSIFGIIIVGKLSSNGSGKTQNVDSLIFGTPTTQTPSTPSTTPSTPSTDASTEYKTYSEVIYKVKDSVVEINTSFVVNSITVSSSAGSGVIIGSFKIEGVDAGYYVVTNAHVIEDGNGNVSNKIVVTTTDGKKYPVKAVRGSDSYGDIAVLMIETTDKLTGASFGNSNELVIGQEVIAIGNPLGELGGTATNGIISALDREIEIDGNYFNLLQTNAAINSGNSGGGLFDMKGKLIGIVNAKSSGLGVEGIGFAIPSNDAKAIVNDIVEFGYVKGRPFIGVTAGIISDRLSSYVYVHDLAKGYNDNILQVQDIIITMNGVDISSLEDFRSVVSRTKPKDTIEAYIRRGNEYLTVTIMVHEKPN
ncbi:MAG: trypsin-like peptidase domain-containing protein [Clostridia bacterium]|nr:trypsin-like peptidase domain-containing protein [Clostridia bacterium]